MRRIAHTSDLHFGRADPHLVEALRKDLERQAPHLIAISGDFTQRARRREFAAARDFLETLPAPVVCVPGNHDIPTYNPLARFADPRRRYREYIGPHCRARLVDEEIAAAAVDTTAAARLSFDWAGGRIKSKRVAEVLNWISAETKDHFTIVVAHHVVKSFIAGSSRGDRLRRRALDALARAGVDLVLGGHHHRADARVYSSGEGLPGILVVHSATSTSGRLRGEPNSYNLLEVDQDHVLCRVRAAAGGGFAEARTMLFRRVRHEPPATGGARHAGRPRHQWTFVRA